MKILSLSAGTAPESTATEVGVFTSIEELTIERHTRFQQQLIYSREIGHTVQDISQHFHRLYNLLAAGRLEDATEETAHLHGTFSFLLDGTHLDLLAFSCLVAHIDGRPVDDLTPDGLKRTAAALTSSGLTEGRLRSELSEVKKNFALN